MQEIEIDLQNRTIRPLYWQDGMPMISKAALRDLSDWFEKYGMPDGGFPIQVVDDKTQVPFVASDGWTITRGRR